MLQEFDPAGAAACQNREIAVVPDTVDELGGFLHDREIGCKIRVEHLVEAQHTERRHHLACADGPRFHAEGLADCDPHRGGGLNNDGLCRIVQRAPDRVFVINLAECADRARLNTLSAEDTFRFREGAKAGRCDDRFKSPSHS